MNRHCNSGIGLWGLISRRGKQDRSEELEQFHSRREFLPLEELDLLPLAGSVDGSGRCSLQSGPQVRP